MRNRFVLWQNSLTVITNASPRHADRSMDRGRSEPFSFVLRVRRGAVKTAPGPLKTSFTGRPRFRASLAPRTASPAAQGPPRGGSPACARGPSASLAAEPARRATTLTDTTRRPMFVLSLTVPYRPEPRWGRRGCGAARTQGRRRAL